MTHVVVELSYSLSNLSLFPSLQLLCVGVCVCGEVCMGMCVCGRCVRGWYAKYKIMCNYQVHIIIIIITH